MGRGEGQRVCQSGMNDEFIVDRIEGEYLIVENSIGDMIHLKSEEVLGTVKEGSILMKRDNKYIVDSKKTEERENKIKSLMKGMWG